MTNCNCNNNCGCKKNIRPRTIVMLIAMVSALAFFSSCKKPDNTKNYNRLELLTHTRDEVILPGFAEMHSLTAMLKSKAILFEQNPTWSGLDSLRSLLHQAWLGWQSVSMFGFGPADDVSLRNAVCVYPTDTALIHANISAGNWDLDQASQYPAKGFPAMEFLLFGMDSTQAFSRLQSDAIARGYLADLAIDLELVFEAVNLAWTNTYSGIFISNTGTDVGSGTGLFVNAFNLDVDLMKNGQVGIPLGKKTLGVPLPEKCESFYGKKSLDLLKAHVTGLQDAFTATSASGTNAYGLDDALLELETKTADETPLGVAILENFILLSAALDAIPSNLEDAVLNHPAEVNAAYDLIQQLIIKTKSDMASAMGILITYQDTDGD